jgi:hypothetical protein
MHQTDCSDPVGRTLRSTAPPHRPPRYSDTMTSAQLSSWVIRVAWCLSASAVIDGRHHLRHGLATSGDQLVGTQDPDTAPRVAQTGERGMRKRTRPAPFRLTGRCTFLLVGTRVGRWQ